MGRIPVLIAPESLMNLVDLPETKRARTARAKKPSLKKAATKLKRLPDMSEAELRALPEREFLRRLSPQGRRSWLAFKKLKGKL